MSTDEWMTKQANYSQILCARSWALALFHNHLRNLFRSDNNRCVYGSFLTALDFGLHGLRRAVTDLRRLLLRVVNDKCALCPAHTQARHTRTALDYYWWVFVLDNMITWWKKYCTPMLALKEMKITAWWPSTHGMIRRRAAVTPFRLRC